MAFTITLYNCKDDPRSLNKTLENGTPISSVKPTGTVDLLSPTFELSYSSTNDKDLTTKNYCVVGSPFNRSYFITDMKIDIGKKIIISCAVDVLETYKDGIKNISANVIRQEKLTEPYLPDSEYKIKSGFQNETYSWFSQTGNSVFDPIPYYILNILGGGAEYSYIALTQEPSDWAVNWGDYYVYDSSVEEYLRIFGVYATDPGYQTVINEYGAVYKRIKV